MVLLSIFGCLKSHTVFDNWMFSTLRASVHGASTCGQPTAAGQSPPGASQSRASQLTRTWDAKFHVACRLGAFICSGWLLNPFADRDRLSTHGATCSTDTTMHAVLREVQRALR